MCVPGLEPRPAPPQRLRASAAALTAGFPGRGLRVFAKALLRCRAAGRRGEPSPGAVWAPLLLVRQLCAHLLLRGPGSKGSSSLPSLGFQEQEVPGNWEELLRCQPQAPAEGWDPFRAGPEVRSGQAGRARGRGPGTGSGLCGRALLAGQALWCHLGTHRCARGEDVSNPEQDWRCG